MADEIQQIKEKIDIVDFISQYLPLKRAGRNFKALCPFHTEKNPSFFVSPERQVWKCFGCNRGGDVFTFLMEKEGLEFGEALRILAQKAGVVLSRDFSPEKTKKKERLLALVHLTSEFYHYLLTKHKIGKGARKYLESRAVDSKAIEQFKLGYAPDSWETTGKFLLSRKFTQKELLESGLIISKTLPAGRQADNRQPTTVNRNWYDRFRGRIIFPVFDLLGRAVGFSARTLVDQEDVPKYINSPDSVIFHKGRLLYGLNLAKDEIRKKDSAILVEGNVDVISCYQAGIEKVAAPLGTGLTEEQAKLIKRFTQNLTFSFDNDDAGEKATLRGIELASVAGLDCKVATITNAKDPDEAVNKNLAQFKKDLENAQPVFDYLLSLGKQKYDISTSSGKRQIAALILPYVAATIDEIVKDSLVRRLADELGVGEKSVWQELATKRTSLDFARGKQREGKTEAPQPVTKPREELLAEHFLTLLIATPKILWGDEKLGEILKKVKNEYFPTDALPVLWQAIKKQLTELKKLEIGKLDKDLSESEKKVLDLLFLKIPEKIESEERFLKELEAALEELETLFLRKEISRLTVELRQAEKEGNLEKVTQLKSQISKLTKLLK